MGPKLKVGKVRKKMFQLFFYPKHESKNICIYRLGQVTFQKLLMPQALIYVCKYNQHNQSTINYLFIFWEKQ